MSSRKGLLPWVSKIKSKAGKKRMIYKIYAVETSTGLPFERSGFDSCEEAEAYAKGLQEDGYEQISVSECYSSMDEMYADLPER